MKNYNSQIKKISEIVGEDNVKLNESMKKHTTFKVGGNADIFITANSVDKIKKILDLKLSLPITIVGNGSNIIVKDNGIRGIVLKYSADSFKIDKYDDYCLVEADSGILNGKLSMELLKNEIAGFEFISCIPGSLGGAIFMNAGAFGGEICDIIENVTYIDLSDNTVHTINNQECGFKYRKSIFIDKKLLILKTTLRLHKGNKQEIEAKMNKYRNYRIETQPLDYPNGGSTFKRGDGFITAKLIDEAGLKGTKIGGAEVSTKHAGFIINSDNATAEDIINLTKYVQDEIYKKYNKKIELEVRILGE